MYNTSQKCWVSGGYEEAVLIWCQESFNRDNPEALYTLADHMLAQASKGKQTADAVYLMQRSAELGYARGALAMGQMFQYGWAVHRSAKTAREWYEKAAAMGSGEAAALLERLRRTRRRQRLAAVLSIAGAAAVAVGIGWFLRLAAGPQGILVGEDTALIVPATMEEFNQALDQLIEANDDELVIRGMRSTNRLLLKFDGDGIDLTRFPAATVIADEDNYLVIQFASEEEAQRCLEAMRGMGSVLFADMDEYNVSVGGSALHHSSGIPYTSSYTGDDYYTWGVEYLGLDQLAAWLKTQQTVPVTVAVLDTGSEPCGENRHRYLEGADMDQPDRKGWVDEDGHGTHVAGTILDCTWGLDVSILPVQVFKGNAGAPTSYIVQGLKLAIAQPADVINMSLGGPCKPCGPDEDCGTPEDYYIRQAVAQGIVVVVAAGNETADSSHHCPAHIGECIVVAACDRWGASASFSNYGQSVDVCAPGVDIVSYYPGGTFAALDGTSMASPHIAALAAMLKMYLPDKTPAQIEKYIVDYCTEPDNSGRYGAGIPWAGYFAGN